MHLIIALLADRCQHFTLPPRLHVQLPRNANGHERRGARTSGVAQSSSWPSRDGAVAHATESEISTSTRKFKIIGHAKAAAYTRRAFV